MTTTWRATDADLDAALADMAELPLHPGVTADRNGKAWRDAWRICIEGERNSVIAVALCDLAEAVWRVRQGVLGHPWHPTPPEFRMLCNRVHVERSLRWASR